MDFMLTQEHTMVQKMVGDFAAKEVAPVIKEFDRRQEAIPWMLPRMGELGILGICFPVRNGGQGMDYISLGLACEELEAVDTVLRVVMSVHVGLCGMTLPMRVSSAGVPYTFTVPWIPCFFMASAAAMAAVQLEVPYR